MTSPRRRISDETAALRAAARVAARAVGLTRHEEHLVRNGWASVQWAMKREKLEEVFGLLRPVSVDGIELVRLGPDADGGYLVPNDFEGVGACYSAGVDVESGFERDCAERGMDVFLADASVDGPAVDHPRFHFLKKFIAAAPSENSVTYDQWLAETTSRAPGGPVQDYLLQMDIESSEYEVILNMSAEALRGCRILIVEMHYLDWAFAANFFPLFAACVRKLAAEHVCVHAHPNNCCGSVTKAGFTVPTTCEFTFLRRDRVSGTSPVGSLPHPLDRDCVPALPSLEFDAFWTGE